MEHIRKKWKLKLKLILSRDVKLYHKKNQIITKNKKIIFFLEFNTENKIFVLQIYSILSRCRILNVDTTFNYINISKRKFTIY